MSQTVSLDSLLQNQQDLHRRITNAYANLKKIGASSVTIGIAEARLQALEQNWRKFESQHEYLLAHFQPTLKGNPYVVEDVFGSAEEAFLTQKGQFLDVLSNLKATTASETSMSQPIHGNQELASTPALPRIQIPHFSGRYEDWLPFRDLFTSLIRKQPSLTNVEKLHFLKTSVKGEAEQLLKNIPVTNDNLTRAWTMLTETYENKRLIVRSHLTSLVSLPAMTTESYDELKLILHTMCSVVGGMRCIERPIDTNPDLLIHLIVDRLDRSSRRDWEQSISGTTEPPDYETLKTFLENRLRTLEALRPPQSGKGETKSSKVSAGPSSRRMGQPAKTHVAEKKKPAKGRCPLCSKDHFILYCGEYQAKQPSARKEVIKMLHLCSNCLGRHPVAECRSTKRCSRCSEAHHTSIHEDTAVETTGNVEETRTSLTSRRVEVGCKTILLATALVKVRDHAGDHHLVRALIDPGSEVSLVSESLVQRLRLSRRAASVPIVGVGAQSSGVSRGRVTVSVSSRVSAAKSIILNALILPTLTTYGVKCRDVTMTCSHLTDLTLADPFYCLSEPVELLLGVDVYAEILEDGLRRGPPNTPVAQNTAFGWILSGVVDGEQTRSPVSSLQCCCGDDLTSLVRAFWEQEETPRAPCPWTEEELQCEKHYQTTHFRLHDGRYVVRLPVKTNLPDLSDTRHAAEALLKAMERKFRREAQFKERYHSFLKEYLSLDHMGPAAETTTPGACYLPHHGVIKESSSTTKLRCF